MASYTYHDTPTDEEMLEGLGGLHGGELITNTLGQPITLPSDYHWRHDLVWVDQQLKALTHARHAFDHQRLIQPEAFGAEKVILAPDPLLDALTTVFTVLVTMFEKTDIGQHYRPSPYATRFLWAFGQCKAWDSRTLPTSVIATDAIAATITSASVSSWKHSLSAIVA